MSARDVILPMRELVKAWRAIVGQTEVWCRLGLSVGDIIKISAGKGGRKQNDEGIV